MQIKNRTLWTTCLIIVAFSACSNHNDDNSTDTGIVQEAIKVTVAQAKKMEYVPTLNFAGTAEAYREADLGSSIPGRVEKINFNKGDYVSKGSVIAEMSDELLIQSKIEMETLKKDFERIERLRAKESISEMDYDHIKAKYEASKAKVDMLRKNTSIIAPFSGVITDIMVNEGENYSFIPSLNSDLKVESGIIALKQLNPLKVSIEVNEKELGYIKKGQNATFKFDAYKDETFAGKVSYISPILSPMTRTAKVEITLPNNNSKLSPGMYCHSTISLQPQEGVFVPMNAILRLAGTGEEYVFVVNDDLTVTRRQINRGNLQDGMVLVPDLTGDERIVVDGKGKLSDGSAIEII